MLSVASYPDFVAVTSEYSSFAIWHRFVAECRIEGFPTIKAWVNGKAAGEYSGERSASAIKDWALALLPNRVATVNKQSQVRFRSDPT